ncbi:MAG: LD-carboxypeptidase [Ancrocorticia sp.]
MARLFLTSCSNPTFPWATEKIPALKEALAAHGHTLDTSGVERLFAASSTLWRWDPRERADLLNRAFGDPNVEAILDISGGDLANETLPYLDIPAIASHPKLMVGYSDMSCILGALPYRTLLWNPLVGLETSFSELDRALAGEVIRPVLTAAVNTASSGPGYSRPAEISPEGNTDELPTRLSDLPWFGGNIRCFLKLAGTQFWPNLSGGVLLIEGQGPGLTSVAALLGHHRTLGTFEQVEGVVVGQFTKIDASNERPELLSLVREYAGSLPVAEVPSIGHSATSGAVTLG